MVSGTTGGSESAPPTMAFFMPSGEEVSFCAHAAIGGATAMGDDREASSSSWDFRAATTRDPFRVDMVAEEGGETGASSGKSRRCNLHMKGVPFREAPLSQTGSRTLGEWSDELGWSIAGNGNDDGNNKNEGIRNASVARPKTLVELESVDAVQRAGVPSAANGLFADACDAMDGSTGVYVYAPVNKNDGDAGGDAGQAPLAFECRQFPRSSGYPEDPATGIAAAALAASVWFGGGGEEIPAAPASFDVYQGTAMGRPSLIQVVGLRIDGNDGNSTNNGDEENGPTIAFGLQGRVGIDDASTIRATLG